MSIEEAGSAAPDSQVSAYVDRQPLDRVTFAKAALRRELCSWHRVMITDSKCLRLHAMGKPAGRWCTPATRGMVASPKHSTAAHVYLGVTYRGTTSLKVVTGTHKQISNYLNPKARPSIFTLG